MELSPWQQRGMDIVLPEDSPPREFVVTVSRSEPREGWLSSSWRLKAGIARLKRPGYGGKGEARRGE